MDDRLQRLISKAVPPMPAPPDRLTNVGTIVRRRRRVRAVAAAVALASTMVGVMVIPRVLAPAPVPAAPTLPADSAPTEPVDPICQPTPYVTPAPTPFGTDWPPQLAGSVRVTLCEWRLQPTGTTAGYSLITRFTVTENVDRIAAAVLSLPADEVRPDAFHCTDADTNPHQAIIFDRADGARVWIRLTCDVAWQSFWGRYGARGLVEMIVSAYAHQGGTESPLTT